jgi:hypothetical protein
MAPDSISEVEAKMIDRILYLFVLETKKNPKKQGHGMHLAIAEKFLTGDYEREKIAKSFGVTLRTVDRGKKVVTKLMEKYAKTDPELVDLWDAFVELDNRPPDYGHQREPIDKSLDDVDFDDELEDIKPEEELK